MSLSLSTTASRSTRPRRAPLPTEFLIAVHAALVARSKGHEVEHYHQAKVAEDVLTTALPEFADGIRQVAARKGMSGFVGATIGAHLSGPAAAALAALWSIRNARLSGIYAIFLSSARKAGFGLTLIKLLGSHERKRLLHRIDWRGAIQP